METCSHLLEIRRVMDKCLICDIQVQDIHLSATGLQIQTNKWLHLEDWLEMDAAIERLLEPYKQSETLDGFESKNFHLGGAIRVDCKKMKVSRSHKRILGEEKKYLPIALDIRITKINTIALMEQITIFEEKLSQFNTNGKISPINEEEKNMVHKESLREYDPTAHTLAAEHESSEYVPYTASVKTPSKLDTSGSAISEPYSPKPISIEESTPDQISESPNQVPNYKPARIPVVRIKETDLTENNNEKPKSSSSRRRHSPEAKIKPKSGESSSQSQITKRKASHKSKPTRNAELFGSDDSDQELKSPFKATLTKSCQSPKHHTIPMSIPSSHDKESKRKRLKLRHEPSSQNKTSLDGWLSKGSIKDSDKTSEKTGKTSEKTDKANGKSSSKKSSRHESSKSSISKEDPKKKESEAQKIKELAALQELRELLKAKRKSPPKEIEILSLNHLSSEEILETFDEIRPVLDPIFKIYSKKTKVTGYDGINHMKTLMLIDDKKQLQMLNFLRKNYQPEEKGVPSLTDLYINALVPEWTVNVFMKEFKFTRSEALERLEAQEDCTVHFNSEELLDATGPI